MRVRTVILMLLAVALAGGTAILARAWLTAHRGASAEASPVALPPPAKSVLVAHGAIERGEILKPTDLAWEAWPDSGINKSYILLGARSLESFTGSVVRQPIAAGEPVTDAKVVAPGNRGFLAAVLRPGMRAVSVPVSPTSGISGFVFPGDQVDILITYLVPNPKATSGSATEPEHKAAETILRDVRVIGIDQRLETKAGEATLAHTATLEVTPKQSEVIALASEMGKLSLSLRSLAGSASAHESIQPDSPDGVADATYTLDSEVSPLLPKPLTGKETGQSTLVTILRGGAKASDSSGSLPASRGS